MKKRILSMILALSMMLSLLPVSAFADTGGTLSTQESATLSLGTQVSSNASETVYEDFPGFGSPTHYEGSRAVSINLNGGVPVGASGTGWSYTAEGGLVLNPETGSDPGKDTVYVLNGEADCPILLEPKTSDPGYMTTTTVALLNSTCNGAVTLNGSNVYLDNGDVFNGPVTVNYGQISGGYFNDTVTLNGGTVYGGTFKKSIVNHGGYVSGGVFESEDAYPGSTSYGFTVELPENTTLNGFSGSVYINAAGYQQELELTSTSTEPIDGWVIVANNQYLTIFAGTQTTLPYVYSGSVAVSADGRTVQASLSGFYYTSSDPIQVQPVHKTDKELTFTADGAPDTSGMSAVPVTVNGADANLYFAQDWIYAAPVSSPSTGTLNLTTARTIDFTDSSINPSGAVIQCSVSMNYGGTINGGTFGTSAGLVLNGGTIRNVSAIQVSLNNCTVTDCTFTLGSFYNSTIQNSAVLYDLYTDESSKFFRSILPEALEDANLGDGQKQSHLTASNCTIVSLNGEALNLPTQSLYLVGNVSATFGFDGALATLNGAAPSAYNNSTYLSGDSSTLHLLANNDGVDLVVATAVSTVKPLVIQENGLPDVTGISYRDIPYSSDGHTATMRVWQSGGWFFMKIAAMDGVTLPDDTTEVSGIQLPRVLMVSGVDDTPIDLASGEHNPSGTPIQCTDVQLKNVHLSNIVTAEGCLTQAENSTIDQGTFAGSTDSTDYFDSSTVRNATFRQVSFSDCIVSNVVVADYAGQFDSTKISDSVIPSLNSSTYLADGQNCSTLTITDGSLAAVNGMEIKSTQVNGEPLNSFCLIGNVTADFTASVAINNINGAPVADFNGSSASGNTLHIVAKNTGDAINVNSTKLPFSDLASDLSKFHLQADGSVTCDVDGVGTLTLEYYNQRTGKTYAYGSSLTYGTYDIRICATEGEKYSAGTIVYQKDYKYQHELVSADFQYDAATDKVTFTATGSAFDGAVPTFQQLYLVNGELTKERPSDPGSYAVYVRATADDCFTVAGDLEVGTYTVTEKIPFSSLKLGPQNISDASDHTIVCLDEDGKVIEGLGKLTLVYTNKTSHNVYRLTTLDTSSLDAGIYDIQLEAEEGEKYTAGSVTLMEDIPKQFVLDATYFDYDSTQNTVTFTGKFYADLTPCYELLYEVGDTLTTTVPTEAGSYPVYVRIGTDKEHDPYNKYFAKTEFQVGTYVVEKPAPKTFILTVDGEISEHTEGDEVTFTAAEKEGYTFTGWEADGLPEGTVTSEPTISFKMPANDVTLKATYKENEKTKTDFSTLPSKQFTLKCDESTNTPYIEISPAVEGLGKLHAVFTSETDSSLTYTDKYPTVCGPYTVSVRAEEGELYTAGTIQIKEHYCITQELSASDFAYDAASDTVTYRTGTNADKLEYTKLYEVNGELTETAPEEPGSYPVYVRVERNDYFSTSEFEIGTFTVAEKLYRLIVTGSFTESITVNGQTYTDDKNSPYVDIPAGTTVTVKTVPEVGSLFQGWQVATGSLPDTVTDEMLRQTEFTFTMPECNIMLTASYAEVYSYVLTVTGGTITEGQVFADNHVRERTPVTVTADSKEGYTFTGWEADGLPKGTDTSNPTISFKMPANDVTLKATYKENEKPAPDLPTDSGGNITLPEVKPGEEVKSEDGKWTVKKDETGKTTLTVTDGSVLDGKKLNSTPDETVELVIDKNITVSNLTTSADVTLTEGSTIASGTYTGKVSGEGIIEGGVFTEEPEAPVKDNKLITVTVTGGATINDLDKVETVYVANATEQILNLNYNDASHKFHGWLANDSDLPSQSNINFTVQKDEETNAITLTPVVVMNDKDLDVNDVPAGSEYTTADFKSKIDGVTVTSIRYYKLNADGSIDPDALDAYPTEAGTYIVRIVVEKEAARTVSTYALDADRIVKQDGVGYYLPEEIDTGKTVKIGDAEDPKPSSGGDDGGMAVVALVGGAAVGAGAYYLGTTAYLKSVLPDGVAIPTNREQLAVALWTAAGKPATESTAVFSDVAADSANLTAIRWAVASGLLSADNNTFNPGKYVTRIEVIRTWDSFRQR